MQEKKELAELAKLHDIAVKAIALAEYYNPQKKVYIGLHNELRDTLSHVMEMIKAKEYNANYNEEFNKASSHLKRAGTDAYELLCLNCEKHVIDLLKPYDSEIINRVFPDYYSQIRPTIIDVNQKVSEKKLDKGNGDLFEYLHSQAEILIKHVKSTEKHMCYIIDLQEEENKKKKRRTIKKYAMQIIIGILIALGFFVIGLYVS